ncbi:MAG: hypothetical protein R2798_10375 [Chitinophagales bacterium]
MNKVIVIIFFFFNFNYLFAQDSLYLHTLSVGDIDNGWGILKKDDSNLLVFGSSANWTIFTNTEWKGFLLELDTIGNIIKTATAVNNNGWEGTLNSFAIGTDGSYIFTGYSSNYIIEYSSRIIGLFYKFNSFIYEKIIKDYTDFECSAHSTISTPDNGFIIGGRMRYFDEIDTHLYLLKIDKNGDIIWENIIDEFLYDNKVISIVPLPNGNFLANCLVNWSAWDGVGQIAFIELTTDGDIVNKKIIPVQSYFEDIFNLIPSKDNGFLGMYKDYTINKHSTIIKLDQNYNVLWQSPDLCNNCGNGEVAELPSGDIIVAGCYLTGDSLEAQVHLTKLSPQGNIIWQRLYGGEKMTTLMPSLPTRTVLFG